jgi:hypothetical protein
VSTKRAIALQLEEPTIVRNSVFVKSGAEIQAPPLNADENARVIAFNNVFCECPPLSIGRAWVSHNLYFPLSEDRWNSEPGAVEEHSVLSFDPGYADATSGDLTTKQSRHLVGHGFTYQFDSLRRTDDWPMAVGLSDPEFVPGPGVSPITSAPFRWSTPYIVNGMREAELVIKRFHPDNTLRHIDRVLNECLDTWVLQDGSVPMDTVRFFPTQFLD